MSTPAFLPDTSCMIAAVCSWHEHHDRAVLAIESRLNRRERMVVAAPALIEAYSVLTRLPAPHRLSPADALSLIEANFMQRVKVIALPAEDYAAIFCAELPSAASPEDESTMRLLQLAPTEKMPANS